MRAEMTEDESGAEIIKQRLNEETVSSDEVFKGLGRPTIYTKELADEICRRIMDGESLRSIVAEDSMPNRSSIHLWLSIHKDFSDQYARARELQADTLADELIDIADKAEDVNKARLQVDTRKWIASKLKPKKYGNNLDLTTNGKDLPTPILGGMSVKDTTDDIDEVN